MVRIDPIVIERAPPKARELLDEYHREERRASTPYVAWAAAVGAAGCGRCAAAA
jgi:hypothetical protein